MKKNSIFPMLILSTALFISGCSSNKLEVDILGKGVITGINSVSAKAQDKSLKEGLKPVLKSTSVSSKSGKDIVIDGSKTEVFYPGKIKNLHIECFDAKARGYYPIANNFSGYILSTNKAPIYAEDLDKVNLKKVNFEFNCPVDQKSVQFVEQSDFEYYEGQEVLLLRVYKDKIPVYFVRPFSNLMKGSIVPDTK